jgi:uncharacterized membrane protein
MSMSRPTEPRAGGVWIAIGAVGGAVYGTFEHQASLGLLIGTAIGASVALTMWYFDTRR